MSLTSLSSLSHSYLRVLTSSNGIIILHNGTVTMLDALDTANNTIAGINTNDTNSSSNNNSSNTMDASSTGTADSNSSSDRPFLIMVTAMVAMICAFFGICVYQILVMWLCKQRYLGQLYPQHYLPTTGSTGGVNGNATVDGEDGIIATNNGAANDIVLVHEGRVFNLTGNQRRAVLEVIFKESSQPVTDQVLSEGKKNKRKRKKVIEEMRMRNIASDDNEKVNIIARSFSDGDDDDNNNNHHDKDKYDDDDDDIDSNNNDKAVVIVIGNNNGGLVYDNNDDDLEDLQMDIPVDVQILATSPTTNNHGSPPRKVVETTISPSSYSKGIGVRNKNENSTVNKKHTSDQSLLPSPTRTKNSANTKSGGEYYPSFDLDDDYELDDTVKQPYCDESYVQEPTVTSPYYQHSNYDDDVFVNNDNGNCNNNNNNNNNNKANRTVDLYEDFTRADTANLIAIKRKLSFGNDNGAAEMKTNCTNGSNCSNKSPLFSRPSRTDRVLRRHSTGSMAIHSCKTSPRYYYNLRTGAHGSSPQFLYNNYNIHQNYDHIRNHKNKSELDLQRTKRRTTIATSSMIILQKTSPSSSENQLGNTCISNVVQTSSSPTAASASLSATTYHHSNSTNRSESLSISSTNGKSNVTYNRNMQKLGGCDDRVFSERCTETATSPKNDDDHNWTTPPIASIPSNESFNEEVFVPEPPGLHKKPIFERTITFPAYISDCNDGLTYHEEDYSDCVASSNSLSLFVSQLSGYSDNNIITTNVASAATMTNADVPPKKRSISYTDPSVITISPSGGVTTPTQETEQQNHRHPVEHKMPSQSGENVVASNVEANVNGEFSNDCKIDVETLKDDVPFQRHESFSTIPSEYTYDDDSTTGENVCPICLCGYTKGDILVVSKYCTHVFHKDCILEWLEKHDECPICRVGMVTDSELNRAATSLVGKTRMYRAVASMQTSSAGNTTPYAVRMRHYHQQQRNQQQRLYQVQQQQQQHQHQQRAARERPVNQSPFAGHF